MCITIRGDSISHFCFPIGEDDYCARSACDDVVIRDDSATTDDKTRTLSKGI